MKVRHPALVVGLTGGIGAGKSEAAKCFSSLNTPVIDADDISRALTMPGGIAIAPIRVVFGDQFIKPDGGLDRQAMRVRVFGSESERLRLESILHPLVHLEVERQIEHAINQQQPEYVVHVAPLLIETGFYRDKVDRVLVIDCEEEQQINRVIQRSGLSRDEVQEIIVAQARRDVRLAIADDVIENFTTPEELSRQVFALHERYKAMGERMRQQ